MQNPTPKDEKVPEKDEADLLITQEGLPRTVFASPDQDEMKELPQNEGCDI